MPNWNLLYSQGRCKAIGVPWSPEEAHAVYIERVPVEFVRRGHLTQEDFKRVTLQDEAKKEKTRTIPLLHLKKNQLEHLCRKNGISFTDEAPRASLLECLQNAGFPKSVSIDDVPFEKT